MGYAALGMGRSGIIPGERDTVAVMTINALW